MKSFRLVYSVFLGVLMMLLFPVQSSAQGGDFNAQTRDAFMFGGMGLNFSGVDRTEMYLDSVDRVQALPGVEVSVTNHEGAGQIFARADQLANRRSSDPHPFVDPEGFYAWLDTLEENAEAKLIDERAAAEAN